MPRPFCVKAGCVTHNCSSGKTVLARVLLIVLMLNACLLQNPRWSQAQGSESWIGVLEEHRGRRVRVVLKTAEDQDEALELEGKLLRVEADFLVLKRRSSRHTLPASRVQSVERLPRGRIGATLAGAVLWGGAAALIFEAEPGREDLRYGEIGAAVLSGALVGALYDYSRRGDSVSIYEAPEVND